MAVKKIDLGGLDREVFGTIGRPFIDAFNIDDGGGIDCDLKVFGDEGAASFFWYDHSEDKVFIQRTTVDDSPGRLLYIQHLGSAMKAGQNIQGMQIRARATGTGTIAGGTDGVEIKAGLNSDSDIGTIAGARAIIANIDAKKGTITIARGVEMQVDVGAGGEITTLHGFRASLNNSGTIGTSKAFIVETANTSYNWDYGLYMGDGQVDVGIYIGECTTGIDINDATTGITVTDSLTTVLVGNLSVTAATGNYNGLEINVANTDNRTAGHWMKGASINVNPLATKTTGNVYGLEACVYIGGTTVVGGFAAAVFAEIQGGTTINSDYYGAYIYSAPAAVPTGDSAVVRLEANVSADNRIDSFIMCVGPKASYWMYVGPLHHCTAWEDTSGAVSGAGGWLKVQVGSATRYVALYTGNGS